MSELNRIVAVILVFWAGTLLMACENVPRVQANVLPLDGNTAYSGAPPVIPHQVKELGRGECLSCHLEGNAMEVGEAKPMKTPHPELERCEQCHLRKNSYDTFKENDFQGHTYVMGIRSQPEGPLLIPHPLTMRENCLGCHGENASPRRLETDHPERQRCVQCHIPAYQGFPRPRPNLEPAPMLGGGLPDWSL
ncbi:MAG: hypothetical protein GY854_24280 [Deltaproteobacteria bacterium]|nr:hypothetical protein [Deltaproteobacteria bacterium]